MAHTINRFEIDDLSIAWMRVGDSDGSPAPLVFLHGLGDSSIITFERIARHPALEGRPSILVDLPGFGYSTAPASWPGTIESHADAVVALLEAIVPEPVAIVGHSMGASLAIMVAARDPGRVSGLVLAEPLLMREHSTLAKAIAKRREDAFVARGFDMLLRATERQARRGEKAAEGFLTPLERTSPAILHRSASSLLADRSPSFLEALSRLATPRVLLVGERTEVDISMVPKDVPIVRIPEAGHSMMSENPDAFAHAIAVVIENLLAT